MAKQNIDIGTSANDGTGDTIRDAFHKANENFTELYERYRTSPPASATAAGIEGQYASDATYYYICISTNTWRRIAHASW